MVLEDLNSFASSVAMGRHLQKITWKGRVDIIDVTILVDEFIKDPLLSQCLIFQEINS